MAQIVLDPGEVFEHIHPAPSTTTLLSGSATLTIGSTTRALVVGEVVHVPANTLHRMANHGDVVAAAHCGHTDPY